MHFVSYGHVNHLFARDRDMKIEYLMSTSDQNVSQCVSNVINELLHKDLASV